MARSHRFHLDRDGHSVTVQTAASGPTELLVDGKVVASRQGRPRDLTVLAAELPGDPPQPFTIRVDRSNEAGDVPVCVMEADGTRELVPYAPLVARQPPSPGTGPAHPMAWLRRLVRRRLRHTRLGHR
ncbi:hypothetical protein ABT063_03060 [Streptomyces sp. NPDC002838]|uniref:hypothetical protein n=1 Tax=Streptomyces sp. NPDC002838 TaxID=3154436 RepID=UPI00333175E0